MFLNEVSMGQNIWQQTKWKLKAYSTAFMMVLIMQILFSFFTIQGSSNVSLGGMYVNMRISIFSMDSMAAFSLLASFLVSMLMANKAAMHENVSVVTTSTTATLSTILFLVILSIVATLTAISSFYITLWIAQQANDLPWLASDFTMPLKMYVICFALHLTLTAAGLVAGIVFAKSKLLFVALVVVTVFVLPYFTIDASQNNSEMMAAGVVEYVNYYAASGVLLVVAVVLYSMAVWMRNHQEVR